MRQQSHYRACESSSGPVEQQSHSHGSLFGTVKVGRAAGVHRQLGTSSSLQQTPDVPLSPLSSLALSLVSSFFSLVHHLYLSPQWKKKLTNKQKKNWQSCVPVVKWLFSPITPLPFARLSQM